MDQFRSIVSCGTFLLLLAAPAAWAQPGCTNAGLQVVSDASGDGAAGNPQLDILEVRMSEAATGPLAGRLVVRLRVAALDPHPTPGAWWAVGWKGPGTVQTTLLMSTCGTATPAFTTSWSDGGGNGSSGPPDSSWYNTSGEIGFALRPDQAGDYVGGDLLHDINALTTQFAQSNGICVPAIINGTDGAGTGNYTLGSCVLAAPPPRGVALRLGPAIPNPARRGLHFLVSVPADLAGEPLEAMVFDPAGRRVRSLRLGPSGPGTLRLDWDLRDDSGVSVPAGSYWVRLRAGSAATLTRNVRVAG